MKVLKYALKDLWKSKTYTFLLLLLFIPLSWALLTCFAVYDAAVHLSSLANQLGFILGGGFSGRMPGYFADVSPVSVLIIIALVIIGTVLLSILLLHHRKTGVHSKKTGGSMEGWKTETIAQYLSGVLIVAVVSFGIAVFSGNAILHGVEDKLIQDAFSGIQNRISDNGNTSLENKFGNAFRNRRKDMPEKDIGNLPGIGKMGGPSARNVAESAGTLCIVIILSSIPVSFVILHNNKSQ